MTCANCHDSGHVCENHPDRAWGGLCCEPLPADTGPVCAHGSCCCGGAGMPCPTCCDPVPDDGRLHRIGEAFTPRHLKTP